MPQREDDASPRERQSRRGAWAAYIVILGLLLFTWPFLREPPLEIGLSYVHLIGSWAVIIGALALLSRALGRDTRGRGDRA